RLWGQSPGRGSRRRGALEQLEGGAAAALLLEETEKDVGEERPGCADRRLCPDEPLHVRERSPGGELARGVDPVRQREAAADRREPAREGRERHVYAA